VIGKLFALPFRILNAPIRAGEKVIAAMSGKVDIPKEDRILSKPLEALAEAFEELEEKR
jgi:hypothetical protein